jgi:hypothetical protein
LAGIIYILYDVIIPARESLVNDIPAGAGNIEKLFFTVYCRRKCANISPYIRRPLVIYDFATTPFRISLYMRKILFSFLSVLPAIFEWHATMQVLALDTPVYNF